MHWVAAVGLTNYETQVLSKRIFGPWMHAGHGMLRIKRRVKAANQTQIYFDLKLVPWEGPQIDEACHVTVCNTDPETFDPVFIGIHRHHQGPGSNMQSHGASSVGYGDIDLRDLTGKSIIYLLHYACGLTAIELGVSAFAVTHIVNPALVHVCKACGMRYAHYDEGYQGTGTQVSQRALLKAHDKGWH